jgi:hypothetical protein
LEPLPRREEQGFALGTKRLHLRLCGCYPKDGAPHRFDDARFALARGDDRRRLRRSGERFSRRQSPLSLRTGGSSLALAKVWTRVRCEALANPHTAKVLAESIISEKAQ